MTCADCQAETADDRLIFDTDKQVYRCCICEIGISLEQVIAEIPFEVIPGGSKALPGSDEW